MWLFTLLLTLQSYALPSLDVLAKPTPTAADDKLSLLFYPAPAPIDWSSPGALVRSVAWNTLTGDPNPLSHIDVMIQCKGAKPILTGMSRKETYSNLKGVLLDGKGLELMTDSYDGYLIDEKEILAEVSKNIESGRVRVLSLKISSSTCSRLMTYIEGYKKRGYGKTYAGFTANPYKGEGAGCAAFGMSVLRVAGLLENEFINRWSRQVRIPTNLMNLPGQAALSGFWGYVFWRQNYAWAGEKDKAVVLTAYDPQLMFNWVDEIAKHPAAWDANAAVTRRGASLEIEVDRRAIATPTDDYWLYEWPPLIKKN